MATKPEKSVKSADKKKVEKPEKSVRAKNLVKLLKTADKDFWNTTALACMADAQKSVEGKKKSLTWIRASARRRLSRALLEHHLKHSPLHATPKQTIYPALLLNAIVQVDWDRVAHRLLKRIDGYKKPEKK